MYNAFIFDLDNTLVSSDGLEGFRGGANVRNNSAEYRDALVEAIEDTAYTIIGEDFLQELADDYSHAKFCVFTTAPRVYAEAVLDYFYPNFQWDALVAFEDVQSTKPAPDGIVEALTQAGADGEWEVPTFVMIGDHDKDILAAYRAGIASILFTAGWGDQYNYRAMNLLADATVKTLRNLREAIDNPGTRLPVLEAWIAGEQPATVRAPKVPHFCNFEQDAKGRSPRFNVVTLGRLFSDYESLDDRREWHPLTAQIHANKQTGNFPNEWVQALRATVVKEIDALRENGTIMPNTEIVFTCIPRKPGRPERMELLVQGLAAEHQSTPITRGSITFDPQVLVYGPGALSHHGEHLDARQRYENVRDNLSVAEGVNIRNKVVFVLDDVMTSGATLYCAQKYLRAAGARDVVLLALAQAISV